MKIFNNELETFTKNKNRSWNKFYENAKCPKVPEGSLYQFLEEQSGKMYGEIAINYFGRLITYRELFREIDLCAKAFKATGIRENDVVSICMANTPEAVIAFYALSKIGAVANMIHPLSAEQEIKESLIATKSVMLVTINLAYKNIKNIIEETDVYKVVIVSAKDSMPRVTSLGYYFIADRLVEVPKSTEKFMQWKDFRLKGLRYSTDVLVKKDKDDTAVILHSGGTSGTPKHILLRNGGINIVVRQAKVSLPELTDGDNMLAILPMFHCFGLVECIHFPLCNGMTVTLVPKFDASRFDKLLTKYHPTVIPGVPTLFEALISNKHMETVDLCDVKYVVSGGDTLNEEKNRAVNKFLKTHNCHHNIVQGYGMTESSGGFIFAGLGSSDVLGSVGIPLIGNDMKIVDIDTGKELGPNKTGEIMLSGPAIMKGYLNNEKETNEVLEKDEKGNIWVHTGDAGYINEDGVLFFKQRIKRMLIVSGYNVYPSHIEEILLESGLVKECCVIGVPHPYKVQVPKAYIVLKEGVEESAVTEREIRKYCEKNLARYSLPKEYVFRKSLPKTMIGKVSYKELEKENEKTMAEKKAKQEEK